MALIVDSVRCWKGPACGLFALLALAGMSPAGAQSDLDRPPISYRETAPRDAVSELVSRLQTGELEVRWSADHGWLPGLLQALGVSTSSQTLVFSKTSKQHQRISPQRPRALYFDDDVYVGWVQGGSFVEIAAVDPTLGATFYTVDQIPSETPIVTRDTADCLTCHVSGRTQGIPGFLVRSVFPMADGQPDYRLGTVYTDHTTPFEQRYGGWYVTGEHGAMRHRGNVWVTGPEADPLDRKSGANLSELPEHVDRASYLEQSSDIVALLLLEHQTQVHNIVTRAGYTTRRALLRQDEMNRALKREPGFVSESTTRQIHNVAEDLVEYLLFSNELELASPVVGSSGFAAEFSQRGPRDGRGRSLRDLDLERRLLRYPCSYLIYSESFNALPAILLSRVKSRMLEILRGGDRSEAFSHLSNETRSSILEILSETHRLFRE